MKKITLCLMATCLSLTFIPVQSNAKAIASTTVVANSAESVQAEVLLSRLNTINAMDKSQLTFSEKKTLRTEVRSIRHQLKDIGGGVYISVGAIVLIIVLLIILL